MYNSDRTECNKWTPGGKNTQHGKMKNRERLITSTSKSNVSVTSVGLLNDQYLKGILPKYRIFKRVAKFPPSSGENMNDPSDITQNLKVENLPTDRGISLKCFWRI